MISLHHVLGFIRGACVFGGGPDTIRTALEREFPQLCAMQVQALLEEAEIAQWLSRPRPRILS